MQPNHIELRNPQNEYIEEIKVGFSWTTFFFGAFVPLFRNDWKWLIIMLIVNILLEIVTYESKMASLDWLALFISLGFAVGYNKIYIKEKLKKGWEIRNEESRERLRQANYEV